MDKRIIAFLVGVVSGGAVSYFITKKLLVKKYENLLNAQMQEMRGYSKECEEVAENTEKEEKEVPKQEEVKEETPAERNIASFESYYNGEAYKNKEKTNYANAVEDPTEYFVDQTIRVIEPREFRETDNEVITLKYYEDDILTDERDEVIDDPVGLVGDEFSKHFGEYEDDCVYVRNDNLDVDYEILAQGMTYDRFKRKK